MLSRLLNISLNNPILSAGIVFSLFVYSFFTLKEVPIDAVPDITNTQVIVIAKTGSLDPEQVEKVVTFPLETELMGMPNLIDVRSVSKFGLSNISLIFKENTDIYQARSMVLERIASAKENFRKESRPRSYRTRPDSERFSFIRSKRNREANSHRFPKRIVCFI